jgi:hypothetical protein
MPRKKGVPPKRDIRKLKLEPSRHPIYRPEFCAMLVAHMKAGGSFPSFAADIGTHWDTLYDWCDPNSPRFKADFSEARKVGESSLLKFSEQIGMAGITGRLERVTRRDIVEEVDPKTGKVTQKVIRQEVGQATFGQAAWIFTMKNRFPEFYKDRQDLALMDPDGKPLAPARVILNIPANGFEKQTGLISDDGPADEPEDDQPESHD